MFPIKSGIAIPVRAPAGRPSVEYPFVDLMVTDSFFVPIGETETEKAVLNRVRAKAQRWKKASGLVATKLRVTPYTDPDTAVTSIGVWRTA